MTKSPNESINECAGYLMLREKLSYEDESVHRAACHDKAEKRNINGKLYCLMHAPIDDKLVQFYEEVIKRSQAATNNFRGAWFPPNIHFPAGHEFNGGANFSFAKFDGPVSFKKTRFNDVNFSAAQFNGFADFREAHFAGSADFEKAQFSSGSGFTLERFLDGDHILYEKEYAYSLVPAKFYGAAADFRGAHFCGVSANFGYAHFDGHAYFMDTQFHVNAYFDNTRFSGHAVFDQAKFNDEDIECNKNRNDKCARFTEAQFTGAKARFEDARFGGGVTFFDSAQFTGGDVHFTSAQFGGKKTSFMEVKFTKGDANFNVAKFPNGVDFYEAEFDGDNINFDKAEFAGDKTRFSKVRFLKSAYFEEAAFKGNTSFFRAEFHQPVLFDEAKFKVGSFTTFRLARFMDCLRFMDNKIDPGAELYFGESTFERPERVNFHSLKNVQPRYFINIDSRKFNFEKVDFPSLNLRLERWKGLKAVGRELGLSEKMLERLAKIKNWEETRNPPIVTVISDQQKSYPPHELLSIACSRLAQNAEENNRYKQAMALRYISMDAQRRERWSRRYFPISFSSLHWWYWASSGYGEKAVRATIILFLIWLMPFIFYASPYSIFNRPVTYSDVVLDYVRRDDFGDLPKTANMPALSAYLDDDFREAAFYSLNVMAFQKPEPKPANDSWLTRLVVTLQTILGPVQAALLVLAIRRKFMR